MPVPYMGKTLKGWTKTETAKVITQTTINHKTNESEVDTTIKVNKQPMPAEKVNRKPEEQRSWKWWTFLVMECTVLLSTDDIVVIGTKRFRIQSANDWSESGFQACEAIEDYE